MAQHLGPDRRGRRTAAARLRKTLAKSSGRERRNAAVALSLFEDPASVPVLRHGLRSRTSWDRWESASCLVGYKDPKAARDILNLYPREPDADTRQEMVRALGGVNAPGVVKFLKKRLSEPNPTIRAAAVDALSRFDDNQTRSILVGRLSRERSPFVRKEIRQALASWH